jgi:hypothetical protein
MGYLRRVPAGINANQDSKDVRLYDPTVGSDPVINSQEEHLHIRIGGTVRALCTVSSDGNAGNLLSMWWNGRVYYLYLVALSDAQASPIRIKTTSGIKAIRYFNG